MTCILTSSSRSLVYLWNPGYRSSIINNLFCIPITCFLWMQEESREGSIGNKIEDARQSVEGAARDLTGKLSDFGKEIKGSVEGIGEKVKGTFDRGGREVEHKSWEAKKAIDNKGQEVESKGWGTKSDFEKRSRDGKLNLENKGKEVEQKSKGFFGSVEDKGRDVAGGLKDAGKDIKSLANKENNKAQEMGSRYIEKGQIVKKRFESKEVKVRKGDTLWALSRKYGVSFMIILLC